MQPLCSRNPTLYLTASLHCKRMRRLICAFVIHIWHKQVSSWCGSNEKQTHQLLQRLTFCQGSVYLIICLQHWNDFFHFWQILCHFCHYTGDPWWPSNILVWPLKAVVYKSLTMTQYILAICTRWTREDLSSLNTVLIMAFHDMSSFLHWGILFYCWIQQHVATKAL